MPMKYMVGLKSTDKNLLRSIVENKEHIYEVYFSWGNIPNGRTSQLESQDYTAWEMQDMQRSALKELSQEGISLNLLFNANCYGKDSQSRAFFNKVGTIIDYVGNTYGLQSVTTTSPLVAKFIKNNFEHLEVRASVNMEIGTVQGMDYLAEYFDSYYMKRELNRNFDAIKTLHKWCNENGKKMYMLANSGCLNYCSAHNFHDNLVAHEAEIAQMDNAYDFHGICKEYLKEERHYQALIDNTNFVRPEDMHLYEPYFEVAKLATRIHRNPSMVVNSYMREKYSGNILELLEPAHSIYPYVVENGNPLKLRRIDEEFSIMNIGEEK
jgi:hypothetical protein